MTQIYAHRGASVAARENTLEAFNLAVEMGADGVELDVRRTRDRQLVVHHDAWLADGRPIVEVDRVDLPAYVPSLGDAIDACGGIAVNIEIKNDPAEPDADPADWVAHRLGAELVGAPRRWLVSSFNPATMLVVKRVIPEVRTALLAFGDLEAALDRAIAAGYDAIHPDVMSVNPGVLLRAHCAGLAVNVWTVNDVDDIDRLLGWGIDGIVTDTPDVAVSRRRGIRV